MDSTHFTKTETRLEVEILLTASERQYKAEGYGCLGGTKTLWEEDFKFIKHLKEKCSKLMSGIMLSFPKIFHRCLKVAVMSTAEIRSPGRILKME